ncbi:MAG: methyltransferase [Rhodobacteraceae bacterium]|nr:methyltransferase [Paracoccaceae bacterium]
MNNTRLHIALEEAGGLPAQGRLLILRPTADSDLSSLPRDRSLIVTGFRPEFDGFTAAGWQVTACAEGAFAAAILFLPRAKALARALVHEAARLLPIGAPIWLDGQKNDGIDAALKDVKVRAAIGPSLSKAHGRAFCFANPGPLAFEDWQARPHSPAPGFLTRPGVFSADGIDPGSALLARHLPADLKGRGADLGAGWGWLSAQILASPKVRSLHLVEAEAEAIACARDNIRDARAQFHWADATRFRAETVLDFVVMNPPFHQGRAADPDLGRAFIRAAQRLLHAQGHLWMVANRTLPYEETLASAFAQVTPIATADGFKLLHASRPRPAGKGR